MQKMGSIVKPRGDHSHSASSSSASGKGRSTNSSGTFPLRMISFIPWAQSSYFRQPPQNSGVCLQKPLNYFSEDFTGNRFGQNAIYTGSQGILLTTFIVPRGVNNRDEFGSWVVFQPMCRSNHV